MKETENRLIISVLDDLLFASKIKAAARTLQVDVRFVKNASQALEIARTGIVSHFIADLQSDASDVFTMAEALKARPEFSNARFVGFYSHVFTKIPEKALAHGFDEAIPRSAFTRNVVDILRGAGAQTNHSA